MGRLDRDALRGSAPRPAADFTLKAGAGILALIAGLGAAAYLLGQHVSDIGQPTGDAAIVNGQSPAPELVPLQSTSPSPLDAEGGSAGTALPISGDLEAAAAAVSDLPDEASAGPAKAGSADEPSAGGSQVQTGTSGEEVAPDAADPAAALKSGDTAASITSKLKVPVTTPPKKPDEKPSTPWVQVR